ncbi:hypothetical protein ACHMW6_32965 [Pseudoduganella sp. UC29_106]|uniref:hypothetical protein n=1 Tax=Pseudoduganella sp. UC29_106 TaxID=3374553 RepID=UPI00375639E4
MSVANCALTRQGSTTTVRVEQMINICYQFKTETQNDLALPYAVTIDGKVLTEHARRPKVLGADRKIKLSVPTGSEVSLFLNSDSYPRFRNQPVFAVKAGYDDVLVNIKEQYGRLGHVKPVLSAPLYCESGNGKRTETYDAQLTGDIWATISHKYTREEADSILPRSLLPAIRSSILEIYTGLDQPSMLIEIIAQGDKSAKTMQIIWAAGFDENVRKNTSYCPLLSEVLPRTHPLAYASLLAEAYQAGVTKLSLSSGWRPMFGSIVHRSGRGLDVNIIGDDMQEFKMKRTHAFASVNKETGKARSDPPASNSSNGKQTTDSKVPGSIASGATKDLRTRKQDGKEPEVMQRLRDNLHSNNAIDQIFDPWFMDVNTHDKVTPQPNMQRTQIETKHSDHLHITISDECLL